MKVRLIYDECNPTKDRRPTTREDIENDIHVVEFGSIAEMIEELDGSSSYKEIADDLDVDPNNTLDVLDSYLNFFEDPGDGSYNILYLSIEGVPYEHRAIMPYDGMEDMNLETATEQEVKQSIEETYDQDYGFDEDDDDDVDLSLSKLGTKGLDYDYIDNNEDGYTGEDFIDQLLIDVPIDEVIDLIGSRNVTKIAHYYLLWGFEAGIGFPPEYQEMLLEKIREYLVEN